MGIGEQTWEENCCWVRRRQPEGMGGRKSTTGNACGGNLDCHGSKAPLLYDVQRVEPPLQPLFPHTPAPAPPGARKGSHQGWPSHACCQALE